jgi:hypothetical protein
MLMNTTTYTKLAYFKRNLQHLTTSNRGPFRVIAPQHVFYSRRDRTCCSSSSLLQTDNQPSPQWLLHRSRAKGPSCDRQRTPTWSPAASSDNEMGTTIWRDFQDPSGLERLVSAVLTRCSQGSNGSTEQGIVITRADAGGF